ncbi:MAG: lipase chaperone [Burkholderiales bacterium]|nr:lipase chaperone [Burkholderiales bacterium]
MKKKASIILLTATLSVAVFFLFLMPQFQGEEKRIHLQKSDHLFSFVRSMEGTSSDGGGTQDADGALVVDVELRLMFDYYLAAIGEKSLDAIRAEIGKVLDRQLGVRAAAEAKDLLSRYISYKQALVDVEKANKPTDAPRNMVDAIRQRWQSMQQIRQQFFSEKENQAMFGFDDAYDMDALARLEISQNAALSADQKKERYKSLDESMSPELREAKLAPYQVIRLEEQTQKLRAEGASDDDIYRMRAAATSPEAAARLADLDRDEAQWKNRIASYLAQRKQISQMTGQNEDQKQVALQQVRDQFFNRDEQKRLPAYE